jgi:hypothetical protein
VYKVDAAAMEPMFDAFLDYAYGTGAGGGWGWVVSGVGLGWGWGLGCRPACSGLAARGVGPARRAAGA